MTFQKAVVSDTGVRDAIAEVATNDPEIQQRVRKILGMLLDDIEYLLQYGTPSERIALAKSVVPIMMKSLAVSQSTEDDVKAAHERIMAELRGG